MEPFEVFEQNLRDMLAHLYDPVYRPPESLSAALGLSREKGIQAVRDTIITAVEALKPAESVPSSARAWRIYGMLRYRYVENLPQERAAEQLGITARHLRRDIIEAIHALALYLWETHTGATMTGEAAQAETDKSAEATVDDAPVAEAPVGDAPVGVPPGSEAMGGPAMDTEWQAQLRRELEALEETTSVTGASVTEALEAVHRLGTHLTERRGITLRLETPAADLMAAMHPSALRQILISVVDHLARRMQSGEIRLAAQHAHGRVSILVSSAPIEPLPANAFEPLREFLSAAQGSVEISMQGQEARFRLELLAVDRCVLVVDDNNDIVHLYRRYVAGTRYYIQHVNQGKLLYDAVKTFRPDIVVLDVMLPDIDGWDLLTRLHEDPSTRSLPVVVCSVMHEKELAMALGAREYVTKPVQRLDFLNALDQAGSPD